MSEQAQPTGPVTAEEICELFPSLRRYVKDGVLVTSLEGAAYGAAQHGSGAMYAGEFLGWVFGLQHARFDLRWALAKWDSAHRQAWAEACNRIATRGI